MRASLLIMTLLLTLGFLSFAPHKASADSRVYIGGATFDFGDVRVSLGTPYYTHKKVVHHYYHRPHLKHHHVHHHKHHHKHCYKHHHRHHYRHHHKHVHRHHHKYHGHRDRYWKHERRYEKAKRYAYYRDRYDDD